MDRTFKFHNAGGDVSSSLRLYRSLMLLADVYTLNDNPVFIHEHANHLAALPTVFFPA
jgi:hypothetical protein